ncbi:SpoIIE family protein phosphatase [Leptospira idonii]|uniref:SpoIIE family protein phosphatase n=1 Tax=Leptospira idonii TaxID=1193500 RepID=UPI001FE31674|nr:SpoIIE family protein phosphatase [Leptospira idonii]
MSFLVFSPLLRFLSLSFFLLVSTSLFPLPIAITENELSKHTRITTNAEAWEDVSGKTNIDSILQTPDSFPFQKADSDFINYGFTKSTIWTRFRLDENLPKEKEFYLLIKAHNIDSIEFYFPDGKGNLITKRSGHFIPMSEREIPHRHYIVSIPKESYGQTIYVSFRTEISLQFAFDILTKDQIHSTDYSEQWLYGLFFGCLGIIIIYNLAIAFFVRDINYLFYIGYVLFFALGQMSVMGFAGYFLFPESPFFMRNGISVFFSLSMIFFVFFAASFLKLEKRLPKAYRFSRILLIILILNTLFGLCGQIYLATIAVTWLTSILSAFILAVILWGFYRRIKSFYYFGAAFFILMISSVVYSILKVTTLQTNVFIEEMLFPVASLIDITLFSFALADRIQLLRMEKDNAVAENLIHQREREISRDILMQSLPKTVPQITGMNLHIFIQPMKQVGGDFYEFSSPNHRELGTLVCDVSGHGIPASLISAMGKVAFATQKDNIFSPKRVLEGMNRVLYGNCTPQYLTAAYAYLNTETNTWRFGRAGHPSLFLQRRSGEIITIHPKGKVIGLFPEITVDEVGFPMEPGDRVLLVTDGLIESFNSQGEMYGEYRLIRFLESQTGVPGGIFSWKLLSELESFSGKVLKEWDDDITFILLELK